MTNSSPQEPQNPIPERRRRAAAGVTFDEMIGIIVAFSTIGAILFWSLGGKKDILTNNFGWGKNSSLSLQGRGSSDNLADADSSAKLSKLESEIAKLNKLKIAQDSSEFKQPATLNLKEQKLNPTAQIAPVAGIAAIPGLTKQNNQTPQQRNLDSGTVTSRDNNVPPPVVTTPGTVTPEDATPDASNPPNAIDGNVPAANPEESTTPSAAEPSAEPGEIATMPDDVEPSYWAYPFVKQMSQNSLVPDFADDRNFEPDKLITRASMATLISQAFTMQPETQKIKKFADVTNENAIAADIDQAVRIGFMQGYSDNEFRPLENIPRYQVLVTLASGLGLKPSQDAAQTLDKFSDTSNLPNWAKQQVAAAIEAGLAVNRPGFANDVLNPNESATRAEVAAMIHQALVKTGKLKPIQSEYLINP